MPIKSIIFFVTLVGRTIHETGVCQDQMVSQYVESHALTSLQIKGPGGKFEPGSVWFLGFPRAEKCFNPFL